MSTRAASAVRRHRTLDVRALRQPAALIDNPHAGRKLGLTTNPTSLELVREALAAEGIRFDDRPTERPGHATELARAAAAEGRELVIAAGGDGTVSEVAQALVGTPTVLGLMPLGSVMNVARTLCIPRDVAQAARVIAAGQVLAADVGRVASTYFLEAAGVGLDAGLFAYFARLDRGAPPPRVLRAAWRFLRGLGTPRLLLDADGRRKQVRAPMVAIANSPFVGAAYAIAPPARIDDGILDVVIFREASIPRVLYHLARVAGGHRRPLPPDVETMQVRSIGVATRRRRPLPVHADGNAVGVTPATFAVVPAALQVVVGPPLPDEPCAWDAGAA